MLFGLVARIQFLIYIWSCVAMVGSLLTLVEAMEPSSGVVVSITYEIRDLQHQIRDKMLTNLDSICEVELSIS